MSGSRRGLLVGNSSSGTFTLSGGTFTSIAGSLGDSIGTTTAGALGTLNISGGNYVNPGVLSFGTGAIGSNHSGGTFNINSGSATIGTLAYSNVSTGTRMGVVNLNGGTLTLGAINYIQGDNRQFNFNGGQFVASGTVEFNGTLALNVQNGGAKIDTNGNTVTVSGNLVNNGTGGLTKSGSGTLTLSGTNSYAGATTISGGTLNATTFAAGGSNSGIGASSAAAGNLVINGGTLQYNANTAPQSTNRLFTLGTGGATFDSSSATAANTMSFTGTGAIGYSGTGNRTLTLTGSNTGDNTLAPAIGDGPGGTTSLTKSGAGTWVLAGTGNSFTGSVSVTGGTLKLPTLTGNGSGNLQLSNIGTLDYTGATQGSSRGLTLTGANGGVVNVSGAATELTLGAVNGPSSDFVKAGAGTFTISGNSEVNRFTVTGGTYRQTGGETKINAGSHGLQVDSAAYRLEAGTLRTDRIGLINGGSFAWGVPDGAGYATLTMRQPGSGVASGIDRTGSGGSPSGPVVREGTRIEVTGDLATTNRSILDLGPTYLSAGVLYDNLKVSGSLNLGAADDTLNFGINPYFLRPSSPGSVYTGDWGTLVLVRADSITGSFDQISGIGSDVIGWSEYTGSFTSAADLPLNTWYVQTLASGYDDGVGVAATSGVVLFHYKVAGSVPEPASAGLLVAGAIVLRALRRRGRP